MQKHHHHNYNDARLTGLMIGIFEELNQRMIEMANQLDGLTAQVASNTDVVESALVLINGFAAQLAAAGTDPVKLKELEDSLKSEDDKLAAAVAANTPAAPPNDGGFPNP